MEQVVRCCVENAASVAKAFITSDVVVVDANEDLPKPYRTPMPTSNFIRAPGSNFMPRSGGLLFKNIHINTLQIHANNLHIYDSTAFYGIFKVWSHPNFIDGLLRLQLLHFSLLEEPAPINLGSRYLLSVSRWGFRLTRMHACWSREWSEVVQDCHLRKPWQHWLLLQKGEQAELSIYRDGSTILYGSTRSLLAVRHDEGD